jgi:ribosomal protein S18 acetylase RimI-like enzyme
MIRSTQLLKPSDWRQLREIRLKALQDSPAAFLSKYEQEAGWTDAQWSTEVARGRWLVVTENGRRVALLGATPEADVPPSDRYLSYMWVAPSHRRAGLAMRLVVTMLDLLRDEQIGRVWLWVLDGNEPARTLYERLGFRRTGETQPLKEDPTRFEERMTRALR